MRDLMPTVPASKRLLILGEAPGEEEERAGIPFIGSSGRLLKKDLLHNAGFDFEQFYVTNVFKSRPPENDIKAWTYNAREMKELGLAQIEPKLHKRFLHPKRWDEVESTRLFIKSLKPDLIICLGGTALWALTGEERIGLFRGTFINTEYGTIIATYHPAAVLREYSFRPIVWADFTKAKAFLEGTIQEPLERELFYSPTEGELFRIWQHFKSQPNRQLGVDIETSPSIGQITTISFSFPELAICIPIWDKNSKQPNIHSLEDEVRHWRWIERYCKLPNPKVFQNGLYDMQYMLDAPIQLRVAGTVDDTAIISHAQQPELPKDLGTLASLYLNEPGWKQMRAAAKDAKAEE